MRPLIEHQIVIGLHGLRPHGAVTNPDEPAVDGAGSAGHRALAEQIAGRARCLVVLKGPDVVHLLTRPQVGGAQLAVGPEPTTAASVRDRS